MIMGNLIQDMATRGVQCLVSCLILRVGWHIYVAYTNGLVQDCSISIANAMEILQSCTKPSIWFNNKSYCYSLQNKIWNLPDRGTIFSKFIYDKEGMTQILTVRVHRAALNLKTAVNVIQSSAIITWSNTTLYCIQHCSDWERTSQVELTKDTP